MRRSVLKSLTNSTRFLIATCLTALASEAAAAAPPADAPLPRPYVLQSTARPPASRLRVHDAIEEFDIQVDRTAVAANPETLSIELPGSALPQKGSVVKRWAQATRRLEAVRTRFVVYRPDWKSWSGTLRYAGTTGPGTGYVNFGVHGDQLSALINFEGERYRVVTDPGEKGQSLVRLWDDLSPLPCGMPDGLKGDLPQPLFTPGEPFTGEEPLIAKAAPVTARIDVLVVYPRAFFTLDAYYESRIRSLVEQAIQQANDIFFNSHVDAAYNLVGVVPLIGDQPPRPNQPPGLRSALDWMTTSGAGGNTAPEVAALRDAFGADVVTIYVPWEWNGDVDACGVAILPRAQPPGGYMNAYGNIINPASGAPPFGDRAFTVNRYECGLADFTFAHEVGHNYGMRHDNDDTSTDQLFPNGRGYIFPPAAPTQATVMGCVCTGCFCNHTCTLGTGAVCNRIGYFSDPGPDATRPAGLQGAGAIGDSTHNSTAVAQAQAAGYAALRAQTTNTPPVPSFTVSCPNLNCTFNGSGSYDYQTWVNNWAWDFGDGSAIQTGSVVSHPYTSAGTYRVHLVVTDSQGQTAVAWSTASPHVPVYEGFHEVANCRSISGWAWDQASPNYGINVDIDRDYGQVATVPANLFRSDLYYAGKGNGYHAFVYNPDFWWQNGQWHSARVRFSGTGTGLSWSPIYFICNVPIFTDQVPQDNLSTGGQVYTVATQFSSSQSGYITQLGFYRASGETGTNTLRLWADNGGSPLASAPTSCSWSGWCWASISPVYITGGTSYRVSVNTNSYQSKTACGIGSGITNQVLTAQQGFWIAGDTFPTTGSCSNFFVDVKFDM
jgi:hypothetical protein